MGGIKLWLALSLSLLVVSSRLCVVAKYGVQEPYMDSFSEIEDYKAVEDGRLDKVLEHSLSFHIEHRLFLTRWLNVGLFLANRGHWDLLLQACVNAVLAGLSVFVIAYGLGARSVNLWHWLFASFTAICFALPNSYENILWGFQSQHFFFILFSLSTILLLVRYRPFCLAWWLGIGSAICSCLSLGSGFYASLAVCGTCVFMAFRERYRRAPLWITLIAAFLIGGLYFATLRNVHSPGEYRADSVRRFIEALLGNLAWPNYGGGLAWLSVLMWLPWTILVAAALLRRRAVPRSSYCVIAIGLWSLTVMVTLSYLRGKYSPYVRYFDYNTVNVVANAAAIGELVRLKLYPSVAPSVKSGLFGAWVAMVMIGLAHVSHYTMSDFLRARRNELLMERRAINRFLQTNDVDVLKEPHLHGIVPFREPYSSALADQLRDPEVQRFLPKEMKSAEIERKPEGLLSLFSRFALRHSGYIWLGSVLWVVALAVRQFVGAFGARRLLSIAWWRRVRP